jgi:hypothetical protein
MDNDDVTVLMIWNGPGVVNKWQIPAVIDALKRKRGLVADENEEDNWVEKKTLRVAKVEG